MITTRVGAAGGAPCHGCGRPARASIFRNSKLFGAACIMHLADVLRQAREA